MRASVNTIYGPPEVVSIQQLEVPAPGEHEVLIRVQATTVNRTDCGFRSAEYFISRFFSGLLRPKNKTLGCEFAGIVEVCGGQVSRFAVGDKVFGFNDSRFGAHAEYMLMEEEGAMATLPEGLSFEQAAPICEGAHYALGNIRAAKVSSGQQVLVYGATGAIGSAAVQLLKHFGAQVTAVCGSRHVRLVQSLGADRVIDYQKEDFTKAGDGYDFIFDAVGKSSFAQCKPLLNPKGIYISTELGKHSANIFLALTTPFLGGKRVLFPLPSISQEDVLFLKGLVEVGKFRPLIDRQYPLERIVDAYRYVETGQKVGNVVISLN
jgi:NADPH:quinone reductase-like Zn-dependent oxidoreductase